MCPHVSGERDALYVNERGKSCPTEILETIAAFNAEDGPIWKPMHMQPIYQLNPFITRAGNGRVPYIKETGAMDVSADIFQRGLCHPAITR